MESLGHVKLEIWRSAIYVAGDIFGCASVWDREDEQKESLRVKIEIDNFLADKHISIDYIINIDGHLHNYNLRA